MKKLIITVIVLLVIGIGFYYGYQKSLYSKTTRTTAPTITFSNGSTITFPAGAKVMMRSAGTINMAIPADAITKSTTLDAGLNTDNEVVVQDNPEMKIIIKPTLVQAGPPAKFKLEIQRPGQPGMPVNFPISGIQSDDQKEARIMQSLNLNGKMMNLVMKIKPTLSEPPTDGNNGKVKLDLQVSTW